jgi:ribosomal protein S18 acetylase RimI-like enzyme
MKMNNQKKLAKTTGQFTAHDKQGIPVIIEWQKTTLFAPEFAAAMKAVWPCAKNAYTSVEMQFLRRFPQVVGTEDYFKPFEPLFKDGPNAVDWAKAEAVMQTLLKSHFIIDTSALNAKIKELYAKDICYVVTIKDQKNETLLGFITFLVRVNYPQGDVKVMSFAVDRAYQNHGLGKMLMSSILKINSTIKRIFLCTRVTNDLALKAYRSWGFTKDEHPIMDHAFNLEHWIFLEYRLDKNTTLQKTAANLK